MSEGRMEKVKTIHDCLEMCDEKLAEMKEEGW